MLRSFLKNTRGNYAMLTAIAIVPIMGGLAVGIDYAEMNRELTYTQSALDASAVATAYRFVQGATDQEVIDYATAFFNANLGPVDPANTTLTVELPTTQTGGGTLRMRANLRFSPYFYPAFAALLGNEAGSFETGINFNASTEVRLKNTLEVALVLDNSGSMDYIGTGSGKKRIDLLKTAAKQLIDTLVTQADQVKQVDKPVQFGLVPFAAAVNVGPDNANASWMDTDGISPIHHENFNWDSFAYSNNTSNRRVTKVNGVYYKKGKDWGTQENQKVTRFTLFDEMKYYTNSAQTKKASFSSWAGCVEQRPSPYDVNDATPTSSTPATLFVPMFSPDMVSGSYQDWYLYTKSRTKYYWSEVISSSSYTAAQRQAYMPKYFDLSTIGYVAPYGTEKAGLDAGPNASCTTQPITPLTDVTNATGMAKIKAAIDAMQPSGGTSVGSGLAWGWRVVSSGEPFTEGRPETEKGNDKVVIVLTDGANTYYTPGSLSASDPAGSKSIYADYGFLAPYDSAYSYGRLFLNTSSSVKKTGSSAFDNDNYTKAMNEQMAKLCDNAKDARVLVMTVSLDLDPDKKADKAQMDLLKSCSSDSRFRKDPDDPALPAKLYWNATGANLADKFKEIADELSNLRIVG